MSRHRIHESNAAKQRNWRKTSLSMSERKQAQEIMRLLTWKEENVTRVKIGNAARQQQRRKTIYKPFIALDGEGSNRLRTHLYTMLSSSTGHTIENWESGLSTMQCFNFLHQFHGQGILVGFYTTYDVNMMLKDMDWESLTLLWNKGSVQWSGWWVTWLPGKFFQLTKDKKQITWYDCFAFFQKSFIKALQDWKIEVPQEIVEGKEKRVNFKKQDRKLIKYYNLKECELLVELMEKVRNTCIDVGYVPRSWHGAGALANIILNSNKVREVNYYDEQMEPKFLAAYYGGRNQILQQGEMDGAVTHDINSAYPYALSLLPSSVGVWRKIIRQRLGHPVSNQFSLFKVRWKIPVSNNYKTAITPFPCRYKGSIYWPYEGSGWYWQPEVEQALKYYEKYISIVEVWEFQPTDQLFRPFAFISELYNTRRRLLAKGDDGQIILKLGINACYGKVAQSIGYKGNNPPYQNYFWAGWITSKTRAMVFELAMKNPESIVSFATDGVIATEKLTEHNITKQLGGWSVDSITNLFVIQPGVYCYNGSNHKETIRSRGFSYRSVDYNDLRKIWREDGITGEYHYKERRFVSLGNALQSNPIGRDWRRWIEQDRTINFAPNGDTSIQLAKNLRVRPYKKMCDESEPYRKKDQWLDQEISDDLSQ